MRGGRAVGLAAGFVLLAGGAVGASRSASADDPTSDGYVVTSTQARCVKAHVQKRSVTKYLNADGTVAKASTYSAWHNTRRAC